MQSDRKKGHLTFRIAAALFVLSAAFELLSISAEVPLFGAVRGGPIAIAYHFIYIALFAALGISLWDAKKWGYSLIFVTTALYTLDKLQFLLSRQAIEALVKQEIGDYESTLQSQGIDAALIMQSIVLMTVIVIVGWWGFALYTYWRRDYFKTDS